jgi:hypothetical protein
MSALTKFTGSLQSTREVQATRIKDEMFIFTGTYPLIYKGDGNLYLMPDYRTSFTEIAQSGHNILSSNFEEVYRYDEYGELETNTNELNAENFNIIDSDFSPVIPYRLESNGDPVGLPFKLRFAYSLPEKYNTTFQTFLPENFVGEYPTIADANEEIENKLGGMTIYSQITINSDRYGFYRLSDDTQEEFVVRRNFEGDIVFDYEGETIENNFLNTVAKTEFGEFLNEDTPKSSLRISIGFEEPGLNEPQYYTLYNLGTVTQYATDNNYLLQIGTDEGSLSGLIFVQQGTSSFSISKKGNVQYSFTNAYGIKIEVGNVWNEVSPEVLNLDKLYEVYVTAYSRFPTPGSPWELIPTQEYTTHFHNNIDMTNFTFDLTDGQNEFVRTGRNGILGETTVPLDVSFNRLSAEIKDYKFELRVRQRGYETVYIQSANENFELTTAQFTDKFVEVSEFIIEDLQTTLYRLEDFPNEDNPTREFSLKAIWSANKVLEHFGKLMVYGSLEMPETAFVSFPENPSYFPSKITIDFKTDSGEAIQSIVSFTQILVVQTANRTWGLKGNSSAVFLDPQQLVPNNNRYTVFDVNTSIGTIAPHTVRPVRNQLFFLSNEGIASLISLYATDDRYNVKLMDRNIENIVPRDTQAVAIQHDNQYWISFPKTRQMFRYYIDKQAWVRDTFEHFKDFKGIKKFYRNEGILRFITDKTLVTEDDTTYRVYEATVDKGLPTDFGLNVPSEFLTSDLDQFMPFHEKRFKELKFDFVIQNEYLPDLIAKPTENEISSYSSGTYTYMFEADLERNHSYKVAFPFGFYIGDAPDEFDYYEINRQISNLEVTINDVPVEFVGLDTGDIYFTLGNYDTSIEDNDIIKIEFDSSENFVTQWQAVNSALVDFTYDLNIDSYVIVKSDGVFMNREAVENYVPQVDSLYDLVKLEKSLGTRFSNFTFNETPFGDVAKSVKTVRLAGSGYGITIYMKDESRSKWTLETIGISYRMRKPRSRT